jgi:hypothetical protein
VSCWTNFCTLVSRPLMPDTRVSLFAILLTHQPSIFLS